MISIRRTHPQFRQRTYFLGYDIKWHTPQAETTNYLYHDRVVAITLSKQKENNSHDLFIVFNASHITRTVELPECSMPDKILNKPNDLSQQKSYWVPMINTNIHASLDFTNGDFVNSEEKMTKNWKSSNV